MWILPSLLSWAIIEYTAHRWFMHSPIPLFGRRWLAHMLHHGFGWYWSKPFHEFVDDGVSAAWNLIGSSPVWLLLGIYVSIEGAITFATVGFLHGLVWTALHHEFHKPRRRFFSRWRLFRFLRDHHWKHHRNPRVCFGALFGPLVDFPMRTTDRWAYLGGSLE